MHLSTSLLLVSSLFFTSPSLSQQTPSAKPQLSTFNSTFALSKAQIQAANLNTDEANSLETALNYERSQLANGGPAQDDFYTLPPLPSNGKIPPPGTLLKSQPVTDVTPFSLGASLALSRIMYTTTNLNGSVVPTTGFVLWPYQPKQFGSNDTTSATSSNASVPIALWSHGTSGWFQASAPSSQRQLWYEYKGPYALAIAGYAVVAPDYAGLGISRSWDNSSIPHQYLASPTSARDALYALQAARSAFPTSLSNSSFVSIGQSQGGGVAWSIAEIVHSTPQLGKGYLGSVAVSPTTDLFSGDPRFIASFVGLAVSSIFPGQFNISSWLTPQGNSRLQLAEQLEVGLSASGPLMTTRNASYFTRTGYNETWQAKAYANLSNAGRKQFAGPLLVIQGTEDGYVPYVTTDRTVNATGKLFPNSDLEFITLPGVGHVPALHATQHLWLKWMEDKFENAAAGGKTGGKLGFRRTTYQSFRPYEGYQRLGATWLGWAQEPDYSYLAPLEI